MQAGVSGQVRCPSRPLVRVAGAYAFVAKSETMLFSPSLCVSAPRWA
jgi:hypothetical protein